MYTHLDLFSGIGGFALGLQRTGKFKTIAFCEYDEFCHRVLRKNFGNVPIIKDINSFDTERFISEHGRPFIITGGFPCQGFSQANANREGTDNSKGRDLWPQMYRIISSLKPKWVIGENVSGFATFPMALERTATDLETSGYQTVCFNIPACSINLKHERQRLWIVAHSESQRAGSYNSRFWKGFEGIDRGKEAVRPTINNVSHSDSNGHKERRFEVRNKDDARENTQSVRTAHSDNTIRQSNDGRDKEKPRADEGVSGLRDNRETLSSPTGAIRNVSEVTDKHQGISEKDANKENKDRALVQERQGWVQPSLNRRLDDNQTSPEGDTVRLRNDTHSQQRMGVEKHDVPHSSGIRHRGGNSQERRTEERLILQSEQGRSEVGSETEGCRELSGDVPYSDSKRSIPSTTAGNNGEDRQKSSDKHIEGRSTSDTGGKLQGTWEAQSRLGGKLSDGLSDRMDESEFGLPRVTFEKQDRAARLKAIGNAVVPTIPEIIARAILEAEGD